MGAIAIIPARGGSKRLPRKNVIDFLGRPMLAFTIEAVCESGCFERIVVSTEDAEIADIAFSLGADVDRRAAELATDQARVTDVCLDLLDREAASGRHWTTMACLYATAPMRNAGDIRATLRLLEPGHCQFAMAVTRYALPPHQALKLADDGSLSPMWPELIEQRTNDLPPLVVDNGSTYAADVQAFRRHKTFYGPTLRGYEMPRHRSVDIDTAEDYELALLVAKHAAKECMRDSYIIGSS